MHDVSENVLFCVSSVSAKTVFVQIFLIMFVTALVMDTSEPAFKVHDLLMSNAPVQAVIAL